MDNFPFYADNRTHIASQSALLDDRFDYVNGARLRTNFAKNDCQSFFNARCLLDVQVLLIWKQKREIIQMDNFPFYADNRTWTCMKLLSHGPEPCASANSAISAYIIKFCYHLLYFKVLFESADKSACRQLLPIVCTPYGGVWLLGSFDISSTCPLVRCNSWGVT